MADQITAEMVHDSLRKLTGYVSDIAKEVYKDEGYPEGAPRDPSEEQDYSDILPDKDAMYKNEDEEAMPYDNEDEEMYLARMRKAFRTSKGFADSAQDASSEEDSKFDEKDSTFEGNEPQPSGDQAGDKDDETFGVGGMSYSAMLKSIHELTKQVEKMHGRNGGQVISKAVIPGVSGDSRIPGQRQPGESVTREMQEQAKKRSFKDINKLRMEVGDLPKNLF